MQASDTVDVRSEVDLHDVILLQDRCVAVVGRVVRRTVVERDSSWKCRSGLQAFLLDQLPRNAFQSFAGSRTALVALKNTCIFP